MYITENEKIAKAYGKVCESSEKIELSPKDYNELVHRISDRAFSYFFNNMEKERVIEATSKDMMYNLGGKYPFDGNPTISVNGFVDKPLIELVTDVVEKGPYGSILKGHPSEKSILVHDKDGDTHIEYSK